MSKMREIKFKDLCVEDKKRLGELMLRLEALKEDKEKLEKALLKQSSQFNCQKQRLFADQIQLKHKLQNALNIVRSLSEQNKSHQNYIKQLQADIQKQNKEIDHLVNTLNNPKKISTSNASIQTQTKKFENKSIQTQETIFLSKSTQTEEISSGFLQSAFLQQKKKSVKNQNKISKSSSRENHKIKYDFTPQLSMNEHNQRSQTNHKYIKKNKPQMKEIKRLKQKIQSLKQVNYNDSSSSSQNSQLKSIWSKLKTSGFPKLKQEVLKQKQKKERQRKIQKKQKVRVSEQTEESKLNRMLKEGTFKVKDYIKQVYSENLADFVFSLQKQ